jgi:hypothetical protein
MSRRLAAIAAGLLLILLLPMAVLAHAELESSTPAADSMVDAPFADPIVMTFSEGVVGDSEARLRDSASGDEVAATTAIDGETMTLTPDGPLAEGEYVVEWTAIADDGHIERGTIRFTVVAAATPEPTASPTPTPTPVASATPAASASASPSAAATPSPAATPAPSPSAGDPGAASGSNDVLLPIVVGALLVGGLAVLLFRRRDSSSTTP